MKKLSIILLISITIIGQSTAANPLRPRAEYAACATERYEYFKAELEKLT